MSCHHVELPDGHRAIVCVRGERRRLAKCVKCEQRTADRLCDFMLPNGKTCDAAVCAGCTSSPAPDVDYCPRHAIAPTQATLSL